jgi:ADP-ribosylglycohydrolase
VCENAGVSLPSDYEERVYAGVLGKIIGVYLGRPFEGWSNRRIERELGEIDYYVHDKLDVPLVVTDDDISGTFTFLRALPDHGHDAALSSAEIGHSWLNYLIRERTVLWWGGLGNSTEHTAYLRLAAGHEAPASGSIALNGQVVAEQIGAQIFIDGWALVSPGDPERAADLAERAARVSHDGVAVDGARIVAAMEAQAFVDSDIDRLIDTGLRFAPKDGLIARMIADVREWHAASPDDWRKSLAHIQATYGYDRYGGNCHIVPNHALIIHSLLHGDGDFQKTLMIVNTAGWDTDCNSGNVGCLMGIRGGLAGIDAGPDWRGPVADRILMPTADGGRAITDAATEALEIADCGRRLAAEPRDRPKNAARFHFEFPGSVQGFRADAGCRIENVAGHSRTGTRSLALELIEGTGRAGSGTFTESLEVSDYFARRGYALMACPTLSPGQTVHASLTAEGPVEAALYLRVFDANDEAIVREGTWQRIEPGAAAELDWRVPDLAGFPITEVGVALRGKPGDRAHLDWLTWSGEPEVTLGRTDGGKMWRRAWVDGVDHYESWYPEPFRLIHDRGTGLLIHGTRDWRDYAVRADVTPHMVRSAGIAARVQGMRRYYALQLVQPGRARLVRVLHDPEVLAEAELDWELGRTYDLELEVRGALLRGSIDGEALLHAEDTALEDGAIALVCEEGRTATHSVSVRPA